MPTPAYDEEEIRKLGYEKTFKKLDKNDTTDGENEGINDSIRIWRDYIATQVLPHIIMEHVTF